MVGKDLKIWVVSFYSEKRETRFCSESIVPVCKRAPAASSTGRMIRTKDEKAEHGADVAALVCVADL